MLPTFLLYHHGSVRFQMFFFCIASIVSLYDFPFLWFNKARLWLKTWQILLLANYAIPFKNTSPSCSIANQFQRCSSLTLASIFAVWIFGGLRSPHMTDWKADRKFSSYSKYACYAQMMTEHAWKLPNTSSSSHMAWCCKPTPYTFITTHSKKSNWFPFLFCFLIFTILRRGTHGCWI